MSVLLLTMHPFPTTTKACTQVCVFGQQQRRYDIDEWMNEWHNSEGFIIIPRSHYRGTPKQYPLVRWYGGYGICVYVYWVLSMK